MPLPFISNPEAELLRLSPTDKMRVVDSFGGIHAFSQIGGGKTSGAGRMLAGAYLRAGWGGLVTAVKPEEVGLWQRYCAEHGRSSSLILFDENEGFNFLEYEMARHGMDGIGTVVECLMRVLEAAKRASPTATSKGGEAFWEEWTRKVLRYALPPLYAAHGTLNIRDIIRFIVTAPANVKEPTDRAWQERSFMYSVLNAASHHPRVAMPFAALKANIDFWAEEFAALPEKTRGNIIGTITGTLDRFLHGRLQKAFCGKTTIVPELSFHGAVTLLAMPTLTWNEDGVIAQQLFKYLWQRSVLTRNSLAPKHRERPLFVFSDEAQDTVSTYDGEFLSMCRGSRCSVTFMTQSLPNYYSKVGGDTPRETAEALVGKFVTNLFLSNGCPVTNEYASRVIGKELKRRKNYSKGTSEGFNTGMNMGSSVNRGTSSGSSSSSSNGGASSGSNYGSNEGSGSNWGSSRGRSTGETESHGYSESMEYVIEPGEFARSFKNGGAANNYEVTGVWFQSGRRFNETGKNILLARFDQGAK